VEDDDGIKLGWPRRGEGPEEKSQPALPLLWFLSSPSHPYHSSPHRMLRALFPRAATLTRTYPIALPTRTFYTSQITMSSPYTVVATESQWNGFGDETEMP
jgi:hypothetical protein